MLNQSFQLIETIAWQPQSGYAYLDNHLNRLCTSSCKLKFTCNISTIRQNILDLSTSFLSPQIVRLLLNRDGTFALTHTDLIHLAEPIQFYVSPEPIDQIEPLWRYKTTAEATRGHYQLWQQKIGKNNEVVFYNTNDIMTEGTQFNLFIEHQNTLITSPISAGLLPGILRQQLIQAKKVIVKPIKQCMFMEAKHIWLGNSVRGLIKATYLGVLKCDSN